MAAGNGTSAGPGRSGAILDAFTRHVAENGYGGTSFASVAAELGISQGLIVHHYGTKERLLGALLESYMRRRLEEANQIISRLSTPNEQVAGLLFAFVLYQEHDRHATVAFQREVARLSRDDAASEGRRLRAEYLAALRQILDAGVSTGEFRPVDTHVQSLLIFGAVQWAWTWFNPDGRMSAAQIGGQMVDLTLGSLLTDRSLLPDLSDPRGAAGTAALDVLQALTDSPVAAVDAN